MFKKKDVLNYNILLVVIFLSFSIILLHDNPTYHVLSFWLTTIVAVLISGLDIMHPYFWFSSSFALYSTAYSIIYVLGYPTNSGYSKENLLLSLVALSVILLLFGTQKNDDIRIYETKNYDLLSESNNKRIIELILNILLVILLFSVIMLFRTPFKHKNEVLLGRNKFFIMGVYISRYLTFFSCFYTLLFMNRDIKKVKFYLIMSAILVLLFTLFTGERDAIFRLSLVLIMTLFTTKKLSKKLIIILIPIGMFAMILATYFKYYFVNGMLKLSIQDQTFIYNFLNTDFNAAGENLQVLLNNTWTKSLHGFSLIAIDFLSPFFPGSVFFNVGNWFNTMFYFGSYSRAFTLVGEGYVIAGLLGVIIIFIILGCGIKIMYKKALKNIYWLAVYIYSIPTIISAFRSTLGTVTIALIRIALCSILFIKFLQKLINDKTDTNIHK